MSSAWRLEAELDYQQEATNLRLLGKNLEEFEVIVVPQPVEGYTSRRVLTMDCVAGTKVTKISPVAGLDLEATCSPKRWFAPI